MAEFRNSIYTCIGQIILPFFVKEYVCATEFVALEKKEETTMFKLEKQMNLLTAANI